jgi:hypothetical protein
MTIDYESGGIVSKVMRVVHASVVLKKCESSGAARRKVFREDLTPANIHKVDLNAISSAEPRLKREHRPIGRDTVHSDREEWTSS